MASRRPESKRSTNRATRKRPAIPQPKKPRIYSDKPLSIRQRRYREMVKIKRQAQALAIAAAVIKLEESGDATLFNNEQDNLENKPEEHATPEKEPEKELEVEIKVEYNDVKTVLFGTSAIKVAEYIMDQPRSFIIELLDAIKERNGPSWRVLAVMTRVKKGANGYVDDSIISRTEQEPENPVKDNPLFHEDRPKYGGNKAPSLELQPGKASEASTIMKTLHDTLTFHRAGRAHSEEVAVHKNQQILKEWHEKSKQCREDWKNGRPEVERILSKSKVFGFRGYIGMRRAFDHIVSKIGGPTIMWKDSNQWFRASMEIIDCTPQYALLIFEPDRHTFLHAFKDVIKHAENEAMDKWLMEKPFEEYADLMGTGYSQVYKDTFRHIEGLGKHVQPRTMPVGISGVYQDTYEPKSDLE